MHCVLLFLILNLLSKFSEGSPCGGSLQANEGILQFVDDADTSGRPCVWIVRLLTRRSFALQLNSIDGNETSIGIFSTEQAGSTFPIVQPKYLFNDSSVDQTVYPEGEVMLLILNEGEERSFTISWYGLNFGSLPLIESANYLDSDDGEISENDSDASIVAFVINPPNGQNLDIEAKVIGFEEGCANLAYSIFEISSGNLREIARTCGRPVILQNLRAPLIAFVAKVSLGQADIINLKWTSIDNGLN